MSTVTAEVTDRYSSGGDNYQYEITYTVSGTGTVLSVDKFSSGGITGDLAIRDIVRNKCSVLESDTLRIGKTVRIQLGDLITIDAFEPKTV